MNSMIARLMITQHGYISVLVAACLLTACESSDSVSLSIMPAASDVVAPSFLKAEPTRLVDQLGREVILRGFNHIGLRSDRNHPPYRDAEGIVTKPEALFELQDVEDADFDFIASMGVNALRLVVTWEFAQPDPPPAPYNETYFRLIDDFISRARARGLYVILDFGQFGWGRSVGGNAGAPNWTVAPTCRQLPNPPPNAPPQASGSVGCAYYNFWTNAVVAGIPLQDAYLDLWRFVATRYRNESAIAMYDLYNEPFGGPLPPGVFELNYLYPFYQRLSTAIREIDTRHPVAFQPEIYHSLGVPTPFARPLGIANAVYIPHEYTVAYFMQRADPVYTPLQGSVTRAYLDVASSEAMTFQTPLIIGETGWTRSTSADGVGSPLPMTDAEAPRQFAHDFTPVADSLKLGWLWFAYSSVDKAYGINNSVAPDLPLIGILSRPYPRAIAGHLLNFSFDPNTGDYLQSTGDRFNLPSEIALPMTWQYPHGACIYGDDHLIGAITSEGAASSPLLRFDVTRQVLSFQSLPDRLRITREENYCSQ